MIDRTNVGISPLLSTPMTTQFVSTPGIQTGFTTAPLTQPLTYTTGSIPLVNQTFSTTPVLDQGLALQQPTTILPETTTLLPDAGLAASYVPQTTLPDQALTSFIPTAGAASLVQTPEAQALSLATPGVQPVVTPGVQSVVTPALQSVVTQPVASLAVPGATLPVAGVEGAIPPPLPSPEIVSTNPLAQTTGAYTTSSASIGLVPPTVPQGQAIGPIMDEDFQRGRPIYDEFNEDRYRGFRLGR